MIKYDNIIVKYKYSEIHIAIWHPDNASSKKKKKKNATKG